MGLIDSHCHPEYFLKRKEWPNVAARAKAAGLEAVIAVGTSPEDWTWYRDLAAADAGWLYYTVGLHPCAVTADWEKANAPLATFWDRAAADFKSPPVALGEIGLDRFHLTAEPNAAAEVFSHQQAAFASGLAIARGLACPVVIHSRGAFHECVAMIDASGVDWKKVVFHCFAEGPAEMEILNSRGARGSFTGILTYKNAENVRSAARTQGFERFMLETDAPYLAPVPYRGKTCEPAMVADTAAVAAQVFGVDIMELVACATRNTRDFFGI